MTSRRHKTPRPLFPKFIADCEERISQLKRLVADLDQQGMSTIRAETDLKSQEASLRQLENHAAVMRELLEP